ncbi:MAG: hypothetical protein WC671_00045 [Candidatus Paceibacterota bacterium]|jgi:hypothetical protein
MQEEIKNNKLEIVKSNSKMHWYLAEKWFRLLEFAFIISILKYLKEITHSIPIAITYFLSWGILWAWFDEIGKLIAELIYQNKKLSKRTQWWIWVLSAFVVSALYMFINSVADSVILKQF